MKLNPVPVLLLFALSLASAGLALADIPGAGGATAGSDGPVLLGADPQFSFNFDIGGVGGDIGSVILDGSQVIGTDYYLATSGTLTLTSGPDAPAGTYNLEVGGPGVTIGSTTFTQNGQTQEFSFDDLVFPSSDATGSSGAVLDEYGLAFLGSGAEINIWGNSSGNYTFDSNVTPNVSPGGTTSGTGSSPAVTNFIVSAPEPSAALLLAIMLLGVGIASRRSFSRR